MSTVTHVTIAEYDRMIADGAFDPCEQQPLELIHGEIREMSPIGSAHEVIVDHLTEWSFLNLPKGKVRVRVQNSIGIPIWIARPSPIWRGFRRDYSRGRPVGEDVLLIVEVSDSSLRFDLGEKAELYAAAGISDYWVVNVSAHCHRGPPRSGRRALSCRADVPRVRRTPPVANSRGQFFVRPRSGRES